MKPYTLAADSGPCRRSQTAGRGSRQNAQQRSWAAAEMRPKVKLGQSFSTGLARKEEAKSPASRRSRLLRQESFLCCCLKQLCNSAIPFCPSSVAGGGAFDFPQDWLTPTASPALRPETCQVSSSASVVCARVKYHVVRWIMAQVL